MSVRIPGNGRIARNATPKPVPANCRPVGFGGGFTNGQRVGGFSTGWTHIVPAGDGRLLFYRASDGYTVTGKWAADGGFINLQNVGPFGIGWTHVVPAGDGRLLFYRASDGTAVTGVVDGGGGYTSLQNVGPFSTGWTQIALS